MFTLSRRILGATIAFAANTGSCSVFGADLALPFSLLDSIDGQGWR